MDDKNVAVDVEVEEGEDYTAVIDRTSTKLQSIANEIFPEMFKVTIDNQNNHEDGKVPILNLKVWIDKDNNIKHQFYSKPEANKGLVWWFSGI